VVLLVITEIVTCDSGKTQNSAQVRPFSGQGDCEKRPSSFAKTRRYPRIENPEPNENARDLAVSGAFRNDLVAHRIMHRPVQLLDRVSSFLDPCIFRLGQPCFSGLPRTQHAYAAPATNLRVAPNLQSISLCRRWIIESPRFSHLPRCRWRSPRLPRFPTPWLRL